ncbi:MAG: hypothetical protein ACI8PZ_003838 [Myxococcota bacterium]|jgi:hypothetical protein
MKKVLAGVALAVVALAAALGGAVATQPDTLHVERSIAITASPAVVFPMANDYRNWDKWDPWRAKDPDQKTTISDPPLGVGAWTAWEGDENVGRGKMTIIESTPNILVRQTLEFFEPWESTAVATVAIDPADAGCNVTWSFDSQQDLMSKAAGLFMDMDSMLGPDFEAGLASLKAAAEAESARLAEEEKRIADANAEATKALEDAFRSALEAGADGQVLTLEEW